MLLWYLHPTWVAAPCYYDGLGDGYAISFISALARRECIFFGGTFLYALPNGVQGWNVILIALASKLSEDFLFGLEPACLASYDDGPSCDPADVLQEFQSFVWIDFNWLGLIWIFTWLDEREQETEKENDDDVNEGAAVPTWKFALPHRPLLRDWAGAATMMEKAIVVLFYSFVWTRIFTALLMVVVPMGIAGRKDCSFDQLGDYTKVLADTFGRKGNMTTVFFLLYANRVGIQIRNIAVVTIAFAIYTWEWNNVHQAYNQYHPDGPSCDRDEMITAYVLMILFNNLWPFVSLVCAIAKKCFSCVGREEQVQAASGRNGVESESTALMVG